MAPMRKRNVIAGYKWCIENNATVCKVNTMTVWFDFENSKGRVSNSEYKQNFDFEVIKNTQQFAETN